MTRPDFWHQVDLRIKENRTLIPTGFSPRLAKPLSWVGLHFWFIGSLLSIGIASWLWLLHYQSVMRIIRIIIWR